MKTSAPKKFPHPVTVGNVTVKIYLVKRGKYHEYRITYYVLGDRKMETRSKFKEAVKRAEEIAYNADQGKLQLLSLTAGQTDEYKMAMDAFRQIGVGFMEAVREYTKAKSILGTDSLIESAQFYRRTHPTNIQKKTVHELAEEYLEYKHQKKFSHYNLKHTRYLMERIKKAFHCDLSSITTKDLEEFLDVPGHSSNTYNHHLDSIKAFFNYARRKGHLFRDWQEDEKIEYRNYEDKPPGIYTPKQIAFLLTNASKLIVPILAIGAFAGLRMKELFLLDWAQVGVEGGKFIEVKAANAKTRKRRFVPISDNLRQWLKPYIKNEGRLWKSTEGAMAAIFYRNCQRLKITKVENGLRHSYISYRVAQSGDANRISLEAGNTPEIIFKHYRALVTAEQAEIWFNIIPGDADEKTIHLKTAVTGESENLYGDENLSAQGG